MKRRTAMLAAAALLAGCAAPEVSEYAREQPVLDMRAYFNGRVDGWGLFTDRSGKVVKRFTVALDCRWNGDEGVLDEDFTYSDGTKQRRIWRVRKLADGRYVGRADDVVGEASGQASGNTLRWNYTLALPVQGRTWHVQMDDWMHPVDSEVLLNRTAMSKFGVHLGDVTLSFRRRP
ncbi:DUF3833 domain-containing protein [Ramlibacter montanisoli]|uniref:DUF3833 domain-containing protein n=1 Tax=Ramlibacter montanisoli TaxID=2732512 RepID=A0A849KLT6_9BURK|nr:DUF3833 domain-containing protein [Ramlibacter montanisoli]NNU44893.1 DUF3833 domain-containing protein [Ramlibacter montanisoli]